MKPRNKAKKVESKTKEAAKPASASVQAVQAAPARPQKIKLLKKDTKYRGAREAWYNRLKEYDGKTEGEFIASTKENPPAHTRNGTAENPSGWVRFFIRQGVMSLHV